MIRFGTISDADYDGGLFRVQFQADDIASYWLSPVHLVTRSAKAFAPLSIGEHVACLMDENAEDGVILGAIYSKADKPSGNEARTFIDFLNKVLVEYDSTAGALKIKNNNCEVIVTSSTVTIQKGTETLGGVLSDLIDQMVLETHLSAAPGSPTGPPVNLAAYNAIKARLQQFIG